MSSLPGRCINEMFCSLGASGRVVLVPADLPFVCPVCGRPLGPPEVRRSSRLVGVTMFGAGICIAVVVAFAGGIALGVGTGKVPPPSVAVIGERGLQGRDQRHFAALPALPKLVNGAAARRFLNGHSASGNQN